MVIYKIIKVFSEPQSGGTTEGCRRFAAFGCFSGRYYQHTAALRLPAQK